MSFDANIAYWAINISCNTGLVFHFLIVLNVGITYWVVQLVNGG
jgi:hypothetical protein